ncbi:MAG: 30S ribosomal protein S26e [Thermoprotei archaeon]|nr:MAG: 30S ribosomal protein S26e [Thermoprotei archaeon]
MPKKRKSRGRHKGGKGKEDLVQCDDCGALIPRSKAVKITRPVIPIDYQLARELRAKGAVIPQYYVTKYLCVRCAIHRGIIKIRSEDERKSRPIQFRF